MRITVLSYIGAEEDIVEQFVRHTLGFADKLIAVSVEHGPTRDILGKLQQEGLPIDIIDHRRIYHDQHEVLSRLLRKYRHDADWFLPLDTDEFVVGNIRTVLMHTDPRWLRALCWRTYVPHSSDDALESNVLKRIRHRRFVETPQFTKVVIPSQLVRWNTKIGQGNHTIGQRSWLGLYGWEWGAHLEHVFLAHLPVRSAGQMQQKIARSWPSVERNPKRHPLEAFHWKQMYDQYGGRTLTAADLTDIALRYSARPDTPISDIVEDPIA